MEDAVEKLGDVHRRLVAAGDGDVSEALAASIPQLVGLIESQLPVADVVILRREDLRRRMVDLAVDMVDAQLQHLHNH